MTTQPRVSESRQRHGTVDNRHRCLVLSLILFLFSLVPVSAQEARHQFLHNANPAQPLFACGAQTRGQMACQAGTRCKCLHEPFGNAMLGLDPGYRWDCSPKHGSCLSDVPAETTGTYGDRPPEQTGPIIIAPRPFR